MKQFYAFIFSSLLLLLSITVNAQVSACPTVNAGADVTICNGQCTNLTATIQGSVQTTSYTVSNIAYSPYSYTTGTPVLINIDDTWTPVINLPFCFQFFGTTYNQFVIGSNGLISFNTAYASGYCQWPINAAIPSASDPLASIMCPWHDIDPSIGSTSDVRYQVYGTAPCREMVVSWYTVPMYSVSCNSMLASQQLVLHETTNIIDMYIANKPLCSSWNAGAAIEGIQDMTGTLAAVVPGRNFPTTWTATNDGKRFMPAGAPNYTIQWTGPSGVIGNTATVNVCPTSTTTYTCTVTNTTCSSPIVVSDQVVVNVGGITLSGAMTNATCGGGCNGSASVTITSGPGPYSYSWAPSGGSGATASGLCVGNYTCTVTGAGGCTATQSFSITAPSNVTLSGAQTNVLCNGQCTGSATVNVTAGTGPFSYSWAPSGGSGSSASSLCPTTYTCTVTGAGGCTATQSFSITQPSAISYTTASTPAPCGNNTGTATVNPSGGAGGYTYAWSPSGGSSQTASGLAAGPYTCVITDANGCTATANVTVSGAGTPTANITSTTNVSCFGGNNGSSTVSASGGTGSYTYSWSPSGGSGATGTSLPQGTYVVTVTDGNGCTATATATITQPTQVTASASSSPVLCNGGTTGSATVTPGGGMGGYTYSWAPSGGSGSSAGGLGATTYTVTVTDANGCTATANTTVTQPSALTANISSSTNILCFGGNNGAATVTANGGTGAYSYAWNPSGGSGASAGSLTASGYTVTVTDGNGCTTTASVLLTQPTALTASTSVVTATCNQANGSATVTPGGGAGGYTYSWSSGGTGATESNLSANTYNVIVTDANGCTVTASAIVPNAGGPTASLSASTDVTCFGLSDGTASVTASGGTGTLTYSWSPSGGSNAAATGLGPAVYTCTISDVNGCSVTVTATVTEPPQLQITASAQTDVACFGGATGDASVTASGGNGSLTYAWLPSGGSGTTETSLTAGTYTCTVTDLNGCTTTQSFTITEPPQLTLAIAGFNATCNGACDGQVVVIPNGGVQAYGFAWNTGCSAPSCSNICAGTYSVTVTDANGCTATANTSVTEPTAITTAMSSTTAHCNQPDGTADVVANGGTGAYTYSWSPSGGSGASATGLTPGPYTVTVTDANGCTATDNIAVANAPGVNLVLNTSSDATCFGVCDGTADMLASSGTGSYTYSWSPSGGSNATASGLCAGNYVCTVTDAAGCSTTANVTIAEPALLTVNPSAATGVCNGSSATISAAAAGGTQAYTYSWNPGTLAGASQSVTPSATTTYTVSVTDANGCTATGTTTVTINPVPVAAVSSDVQSGCVPLTVQFSDASTVVLPATITSWSWDFGDGTGSTQNPSHTYNTPGVYTVILTVTSSDGCVNTITMTNYINVFAIPVAEFAAGPQPTTILNPQICLTDQSIGAAGWNWSFGDLAGSSSALSNPCFMYSDTGCYDIVLDITSADGCPATITHPVCIGSDYTIFIPNTFTPNDDGKNELFFPVGTGIDPTTFEMWIFDRWGNMIFYTDDLAKGWNGKVQGGRSDAMAQIDTYVYKIRCKDFLEVKHQYIGHVNLIR